MQKEEKKKKPKMRIIWKDQEYILNPSQVGKQSQKLLAYLREKRKWDLSGFSEEIYLGIQHYISSGTHQNRNLLLYIGNVYEYLAFSLTAGQGLLKKYCVWLIVYLAKKIDRTSILIQLREREYFKFADKFVEKQVDLDSEHVTQMHALLTEAETFQRSIYIYIYI